MKLDLESHTTRAGWSTLRKIENWVKSFGIYCERAITHDKLITIIKITFANVRTPRATDYEFNWHLYLPCRYSNGEVVHYTVLQNEKKKRCHNEVTGIVW